ncbi:hypothetical protein LWI29_022528 [Acer saccharum]|uniref:BTB domain-containing protein n=1 Tax=Acer saccharum TaxID=4024 RepID=A0AA39VU44_ACESA|nr:hypothetical protein LWI29_022528 [Acer saccharum]
MRASKHGGVGGGGLAENNRGISGHVYTLHQRLSHALSLGTRYYDEKELKWKCTDIEIQRHVVRSIAAFLDSVLGDTVHHPLVKDSVPQIVGALIWILQYKSGAVLSMAINVVVKLFNTLPNSVLRQHILDLSLPLLSLLSFHQLDVAVSCATALNIVLSSLSVRQEKQAWEMLKETKTVVCIITNMESFSAETMPIDYFQEMAYLLSTILWRWPLFRYLVWNDSILMKLLESLHVKPDLSVKVAVLKLYSSIGLCGNGAKKLLENGEALVQTMVHCMDSSHSPARVEGFRLAQCLAADQQGCLRLTKLCCEPLVKAIVCGMNRRNCHSGKVSTDHMSLLVEACRLALITRWAGDHHSYFWKLGIDKVLLDLVLENFQKHPSQHLLSVEEHISMAQEGLNANFLLVLRPYVWDILGWLATHHEEGFNLYMHGNELHINILITCACLAFVESIRKGRQIYQNDIIHTCRNESASRAVLMMMNSPCKYIASKTRFILSEVLKPNGKEYLKHLLHSINYTSSGDDIGLPRILPTAVYMVGLTCYLGLPYYRKQVIKGDGMKIVLAFLKWCLSNHIHIKRQSFAPHLNIEKSCCCECTEEWEGKDVLFLYGLWALAQLVQKTGSVRNSQDMLSGELNDKEAQLVSILEEIRNETSTYGPRWYAAYILSHFGFYGFPSKLGKRIGKALNMEEDTDMQLILANGESLNVHSVLLAIRCPSLLPPDEFPCDKKTSGDTSLNDVDKLSGKLRKEVRLSAHVDCQALQRLLEYAYFGYLEAGNELVKKLKPLAKSCKLQPLLQLLGRKSPKWGTPVPSSDLAPALGPLGQHFSDIILEAKATELMCWTCTVCSLSVPHMHVHKFILRSSSDYLRAMFQSGMQESHSRIIRLPVSFEAMIKLVEWFYTDRLPKPSSGCVWDNMDTEEKIYELQPYVELCSLAELWLLEEVQDACFRLIVTCMDSARVLSIKLIQIAARFSLWKLAEVAAEYLAPLFCKLRDSGDLEELDEFLIDMVRAASVRLSQRGG